MSKPNLQHTYFANLEGDELGQALISRFKDHISYLKKSGQYDRIRRSWRMYYSKDGNSTGVADNTRVQEAGRQGEQTLLKPNRYRARLQRLLNMNAGQQPAFQPIALNTDSETTRAVQLSSHIIEYYGNAKKVFERLQERDEHALVTSEAFVVSLWDWNKGNVYTYEDVPETDASGEPIMVDAEPDETAVPPTLDTADTGAPDEAESAAETQDESLNPETEQTEAPPAPQKVPKTRKVARKDGDFRTMVLTPIDCAIEPYSDDRDEPSWAIGRYFVNKFDLAIQYPNEADKILASQSWAKSRADIDWLTSGQYDTVEEAIPLYFFFHVDTASVSGGKQCFFLEDGTILGGAALQLEYKRLPVFRTAPGDVLFSSGGWSPGFDLLAICQTQQAHVSIGTSNFTAFGLQNIVATKGCGVERTQIGALNFLTINPGAKLEALNLTEMPKNYFEFWQMLLEEENNVAGTNAAANGEGQAGSSGSKEALLVSAAQQMQTRFQKSRQLADSLLFTHMIDTLKSHAKTERIIELGGKASAYAAKTFTGTDLDGVSRIVVQPSNPMRDTPDGRKALASELLQLGLVKTPMDYVEVCETGRVDHIDDPIMALETLIKMENELLSDPDNVQMDPTTGQPAINPQTGAQVMKTQVIAAPIDRHSVHILKHARLLDSPEARNDPALLQRVITHINEHINVLKTADPALLGLIGEQSLMPQPAVPPQVAAGTTQAPPTQPPQGASAAPHQPGAPGKPPSMPSMPKNPLTGQVNMPAPPNQMQPMTPQH